MGSRLHVLRLHVHCHNFCNRGRFGPEHSKYDTDDRLATDDELPRCDLHFCDTLYVDQGMHKALHTLDLSSPLYLVSTSSDVPFNRPDPQLFVYMFLIERVYVVSYAGQQPPRLSTGIYRSGLAAMCIYTVIFALIIHTCVVELAPPWWSTEPSPTVCTIGLNGYATIPLLIYDAITSIALTVMFVVPLVTVGKVDPHLVGAEQGTVSPEAISPRAQENLNVPAMTEPQTLPSSEKARASGTGHATEAMEDGSFLHQWGRMHRERLHSLAKKSCL